MFRFAGIAFGAAIALYYYSKRYWRKFERIARETKDEDINEGDEKNN